MVVFECLLYFASSFVLHRGGDFVIIRKDFSRIAAVLRGITLVAPHFVYHI